MPTKSAARAAALPRHPIQVVVRQTGLSADVIRAWEKRYAVVTPVRADGGRRLYADADIERLRLLAHATLSGRAIGQVAALAPDALAALVRADASATVAGPRAPRLTPRDGAAGDAPDPHAGRLQVALDALGRFDVVALEVELRCAAVTMSAEAFLDALVVPLWDEVVDRVRAGTLRAAHEHVALATIRRALDRVIEAATSPLAPPELVVGTPLGQPQELGALVAAATAAAEGWRTVYVGAGLAAEAIAETATALGARAVTLGLGVAVSDRLIPRELRRLRELLPGLPILVAGPAADAHRGVLREIGAVVLRDQAALRAAFRARDSR